MSPISTKFAICVACAALLSMTMPPASAQTETKPPPTEVQEVLPQAERQSKPKYTDETPRELKLRDNEMAGKKCRSGAGTKAEAEEDCAKQLNCPAGTKVDCQYRQNNQDWICSCK
jgi:hypothetical protein